ncbi:unnamed protein product, partial [Prorocentrum cordatum]
GGGAKGSDAEPPSTAAAADGTVAGAPHAATTWRGAVGQLRGLGAVRTACVFVLGAVAMFVQYWVRSRRKNIAPREESETPMATEQMLRLPQPTPRLRQVGTSFAVPLSRIASCKGASLIVDVPVSPAVWPLRALFSRPPDGGADAPWTRFQLTVDIIEAAGLPPLLCCDRGAAAPGPPPKPAETGGTQQRLSSWTAGCEGGDTGRLDDAEATGSTRGEGEGGSCLEVRGGSGAVAATLVESSAGKWKIQRPGHVSWDVERRDAAEGILFTAYCRGEEVALVTRQLCSGSSAEDESVQVDTLMDSSSPDSLLLFCCMLALLAKFAPE